MEPEINCSEFCDSFPGQELDRKPNYELCRTTIASPQHSSSAISSLSPALLGVVWTFLSSGLLLMLFFLAFTIRCRKNRIVKMSSPNLNIVTLLGSCLTYCSAYLFGIQGVLVGRSMETLIQMRLSMLCIGTSLVFGPILGKSWRLYKVFTQRVPDKRVIIKDLQLLGLVAALVVADVILLVTWVLTDPIQCLQILGVSMTVTGRDVSCSLTNTHFCASRYSDVWIALVLGCKLKQWKAFEGENQTIRHMAKYFNTPSRSFHTQLGEDQSCHLRQEHSTERLLTEKNAVIESLQEQVNNAKEKLVKLMSSECTYDSPAWAVPPASAHGKDVPAVASAQELAAPGPSEHTSAPANDADAASSQHVESPRTSEMDTRPSSGQKKPSDLKDFHDHLDLDGIQKQSRDPERGDQGPAALGQSCMLDGGACDLQRPRQNSQEHSEKLPRVSSVVREKLREVLQDLDLSPEAPLSPLCPQEPWKSSASHSPQKLPPSRKLGFSPYVVRRRRVAQRARPHFPGSVPTVRHQANKTVPGARSGLSVQSGHSPNPDPQSAGSKVTSPSSRKSSPLSDPHLQPGALGNSKQCQTERQRPRGHEAAFPSQPASTPAQAQSSTVPCLSYSPGLPGRRQPWPAVSPGCPSLPSQCNYLDTETSSSDEFFCRCHRPYCDICFQSSSDPSDSGSSDSDSKPVWALASRDKQWARSKPIVNFKDDLKPTLV
uniref:probable G-protein coupled receptor 156 isoform X3 n=1 Tax=Jaculus jaculus TaxID=51337 RepID=UPI001E1B2E90|nr:probable G-protein coupled receptor 156 isoform X3 [Jaculus jaculus]